MNALAKIEAFKPEEHTLEECLLELSKYGLPHVTQSKQGWWSSIDVFVNGDGVRFEISHHRADTPRAAVSEVYGKLMVAIRKIQETQP